MKDKSTDETIDNLLTDLDPLYESKDELKIGKMLDRYGIPFFYKQATVIYFDGKNEIWHPTFTLPQYGCYVIDYISQTDSQDQKDSVQNRKQIYDYNQIPVTVLGPKDLDKPNFEQDLYQKLKEEFCRFHNPLVYKP